MSKTLRSLLTCAVPGVLAGALAASTAWSQTCESPLALVPDSTVTTSTCNGESFGSGGPRTTPELGTVLRFNLDTAQSIEFTLIGLDPWFDPVMCLKSGDDACNTDACLTIDGSAAPWLMGELLQGPYWLIVSASPASAPGSCGTFALLNQWTAADAVFSDGFD